MLTGADQNDSRHENVSQALPVFRACWFFPTRAKRSTKSILLRIRDPSASLKSNRRLLEVSTGAGEGHAGLSSSICTFVVPRRSCVGTQKHLAFTRTSSEDLPLLRWNRITKIYLVTFYMRMSENRMQWFSIW
jgi:hypothetical protein